VDGLPTEAGQTSPSELAKDQISGMLFLAGGRALSW
jgi:hypothetical protein